MKIVVLDGYALNPGDLNWTDFEDLGELMVYNRTSPAELIERAKGADILFTNKTPLEEKDFQRLPCLKYIGVLATGYNIVDINAARQYDIVVTNVPNYSTFSVAQMVFAYILNISQHIQKHNDAVKNGVWSASQDFCFWNHPLTELAGKTIGIIGLGRIGQQVAKIAASFGLNVLAYSRRMGHQADMPDLHWASLEVLLKESDIISLHCPLTPETEKIINQNTISLMKKTAIVINTSRGLLINEKDLAEALNEGRIAWAAVDVLSSEPPPPDNPLLSAKNCLITPHIAWATFEARTRLMNIALQNLKAYFAQAPVNVVT